MVLTYKLTGATCVMIELPKICDHAVTDISYQPDIIHKPGYGP